MYFDFNRFNLIVRHFQCPAIFWKSGKKMTTSKQLVEKLIAIFPEFDEEWDHGEGFGYENDDFSAHSVFLTFNPVSTKLLDNATEKQTKNFCDLINSLVDEGGDSENAVSTCFLEHATQLKVRKKIKPFLSAKAKNELR